MESCFFKCMHLSLDVMYWDMPLSSVWWDGTDKRANFIVEAYLMVFNLLTIFSFIIPVFMGLYHMKNIFL